MTLQNTDLFLVNRGGTSFKTEYGIVKENILADSNVVVSDTAPTANNEGELWYNSTDDRLYIWIVTETTGVVTSLSIRNGGSGYTATATDVETNGGSGFGLTVDIEPGTGGNLANPTVNQGGHGYTVGDYIIVIGAGHQNATLNVTAVNTVPVGQWVETSPDSDGFWERTGTTLSPAEPDDNVALGGLLSITGDTTPATDPTDATYPAIWSQDDTVGNTALNVQGLATDANFPPASALFTDSNVTFMRDHPSTWESKNTSVVDIVGHWGGDYTQETGGGNTYTKNAYLRVRGTLAGATTNAGGGAIRGISSGASVVSDSHWRCFDAAGKMAGNDPAASFYGYYSSINKSDAADARQIYCEGTATSFFNGQIHWNIKEDNQAAACSNINRSLGNGGDASSTTAKIIWFYSDAATKKGKIEFDGSGAVRFVGTHSDYRLKENVVDLPNAVEKVKALRPVHFNYIAHPGKTRPGFIAHELQEVEPLCVSGEKDAVTRFGTMTLPDGTTKEDVEEYEAVPFGATWEETRTEIDPQGVSHEALIPLLTKALQEAIARIEQLEADHATLMNNGGY